MNYKNIIKSGAWSGDSKEIYGETGLHLAARDGNFGFVRMFIGLGANPDARTSEGKTPLDLAIENNHTDIIEFLEYIKER